MAAHYDNYDYPSYWTERDYEHKSEVLVIKSFLDKISKIGTILDVGAGFGRLTPKYLHRAKKVVLAEPSSKLLSKARKTLPNKKIKFVQTTIDNLNKKVKSQSINLVLFVRVAHHMRDLDQTFDNIHKVLDHKGYFIMEFANKRHLKAMVLEFIKGNFTFAHDIFPRDISSEKSKKQNALPFINYHPDIICAKLKEHGFKIIEVRSVSNIRSPFMKKYFPLSTLLFFESFMQEFASKLKLGPSIFVLAQKRD